MSDNNNNNEEKQKRRLEAKREYNRLLSAAKRQQTKDEIANLITKAEFHADRANKLEKKNIELIQQVQVLMTAHQKLQERIQQLTTTIISSSSSSSSLLSPAATTAGIGLILGQGRHGPPPPPHTTTIGAAAAANSFIGAGGQQLDLAAITTGSPPLSTINPRYSNLMARYLLCAGPSRSSSSGCNGGGDGFVDDPMLLVGMNSSNSCSGSRSTPAADLFYSKREQSLHQLDHHQLDASSLLQPYNNNNNDLLTSQQRPINQQELDLLIRFNNATMRSNNNTFPIMSTFLGNDHGGESQTLRPAGASVEDLSSLMMQRPGMLAVAVGGATAAVSGGEPHRPPPPHYYATTNNNTSIIDDPSIPSTPVRKRWRPS